MHVAWFCLVSWMGSEGNPECIFSTLNPDTRTERHTDGQTVVEVEIVILIWPKKLPLTVKLIMTSLTQQSKILKDLMSN